MYTALIPLQLIAKKEDVTERPYNTCDNRMVLMHCDGPKQLRSKTTFREVLGTAKRLKKDVTVRSHITLVISNGFDACDGPSNSGQKPRFCESSRKQAGIARSLEYGELKIQGSKSASVDIRDSTKKRMVERLRKMTKAKGRTQTPATSSNMQSLQKRCETIEKEGGHLNLTGLHEHQGF
ncbi:hypothetical protein CTI12_AA019580 [Artemisia annua]|uniref:Uncharacterized protein n=1 Tax=Artemisia annua TaxID=35608 RepID=A0A2U1Q8Y0_ARTAN|nr:hypothetical protein CTI12_AA019580 [Artemisia annua]